jgi:hypothetical protein
MSQLISTRVPDATAERLRRYASRKNRSLNEVAGHVFEEWLRQNEFYGIENSRLSVAWVIRVAKSYALDTERVIEHWPDRPREWVQAALNYYEAFPQEIDAELEQLQQEADFTAMKRRFPTFEAITLTEGGGAA